MRKNESQSVLESLERMGLNLKGNVLLNWSPCLYPIKDRDGLRAYHSRDFIGYIVPKIYHHAWRLMREWTLLSGARTSSIQISLDYCAWTRDAHHHMQGQSWISRKIKWRLVSGVLHELQSVTSETRQSVTSDIQATVSYDNSFLK